MMRTNLATLVEDLRNAGGRAVVEHRGVRRYATSYTELAQLAGRFSAELERRGIGPGERVVLWGANSAEWIAAFFGCLLRGVLAVPLDASGTTAFARRVLDEVSPRLIAGDAALLASVDSVVEQLTLAELAATLPPLPNFSVDPAVTEDSPFQIVFTSGTTAEPKGVVHTHRNVLASLRPIEGEMVKYRRYERYVHPLRFLHTLPLSHVFGQFMGLWIPAVLAAELHFAADLDPARTVELVRRERISVLVAVPRVLGLLCTHLLARFAGLAAELEVTGLSALQRWWRFRRVHRALGWKFWAVISGGAQLPAELERFWNRLGFALIQGYGMTETAALVTLNHPFKIGQGTIGKVMPGREVKLSESGEMLVRGDVVSPSSWQNGRLQRREDEWLATGDLAERSENGDFRFLGRKGDVIVTANGLNIYPSDVEKAMLQRPGVRACAVVPCTLATGVEPVCVVIFQGDDAALQQAVGAANEGLAEFQRIRRVLRWPELELPYTATGKLLRRHIAEWACATLQGNAAAGSADPLLALIAEITGAEAVQPRDDLRLSDDLYLDSLGRVQLASVIEQRLGVALGDDSIAAMHTLGELRRALDQDAPAGDTPAGYPASTAGGVAQVPPAVLPPSEGHVYPHWPWSRPVQWVRTAFLEGIALPMVRLLLKPRAVTLAEVPRGPLLVICNHVNLLDGPLVLNALPGALRRRIAVAMSGEMLLDFRRGRGQGSWFLDLVAPLAYWLLTALFNVFPLPRLQGFRRSFAHAGEALDRGYSVLVFPEGRRSHSETMAAFRPGTGLLAGQSRVPVLPVVLKGVSGLDPRTGNWFRSGKIEVRIGAAVSLPQTATPAAWTAALEAAMRELAG
jgi:long-chain acyl-CoA synthetase